MSKLRAWLFGNGSDRGAVAMLFVILLSTGVLISTAGLVVDLGRVYVYQKQAQRAADEVAHAMAYMCNKTVMNNSCLNATVTSKSPFGTQTQTVDEYLNGIANPSGDNGFTITLKCGYSNRNLALDACPALTTEKWDCKNEMSTNYQWVRVYVTAPPMQRLFGVFENQTGTYQETACGQSYYGKVGAIKMDSSTSPLPFVMGFCEIAADSASTMMIVAEANESSCKVTDRNGSSFNANGRGWKAINTASSPSTNAYCWTISTTNGCTPVALSTKTSTLTNYTTFLNLVKANIGKTNLIPIVDKTGTLLLVKGFASFRLTGIKFPTITGVSATTTTVTPTGYTWPASGNCSGTATSSSKFCIVGVFENKVSTPYGNNRAVTLTNDPNVPDFGFTIIKHGY